MCFHSLVKQGVTIVDARDSGQYTGAIVRGEGRPGHIPGSINLPREELIDAVDRVHSVAIEELQRDIHMLPMFLPISILLPIAMEVWLLQRCSSALLCWVILN